MYYITINIGYLPSLKISQYVKMTARKMNYFNSIQFNAGGYLLPTLVAKHNL